jgi:hypothetical protein
MRILPVAVDPVKDSFRTVGLEVSSPHNSDALPREAVATDRTPAGTPERSASRAIMRHVWLVRVIHVLQRQHGQDLVEHDRRSPCHAPVPLENFHTSVHETGSLVSTQQTDCMPEALVMCQDEGRDLIDGSFPHVGGEVGVKVEIHEELRMGCFRVAGQAVGDPDAGASFAALSLSPLLDRPDARGLTKRAASEQA